MSHHIIEFDHECKTCKATGLYVGMAERSGCAVVCQYCNGTGKDHTKIEYDDFENRKPQTDVVWVVRCNPGICIGVGPNEENSTLTWDDFGWMPYEDWAHNMPFPEKSEMRRWTCPAWWYQCADYDKRPNWDECGCGAFSSCRHFPTKLSCWARFDREQASKVAE